MIYKLLGLNVTRFAQYVRLNKVPGLIYNSVDDEIMVPLGDYLLNNEKQYRDEAASILCDVGIPANAEGLPPYTSDPAIIKIIDEDDNNLSTKIHIDEEKYPAPIVCNKLIEHLKSIDIHTDWEFDLGGSALFNQYDRNIEWPIEKKPHGYKCTCLPCSVIRNLLLEEQFKQDAPTHKVWKAHFNTDDKESPTNFSVHTHMLFNHKDFQIVLPIPYELSKQILTGLVENVKLGINYESGSIVEDAFKFAVMQEETPLGLDDEEEKINVKIKPANLTLINARESGRDILRVIIPDPDGNLTRKEMNSSDNEITQIFKLQYTKTGL